MFELIFVMIRYLAGGIKEQHHISYQIKELRFGRMTRVLGSQSVRT